MLDRRKLITGATLLAMPIEAGQTREGESGVEAAAQALVEAMRRKHEGKWSGAEITCNPSFVLVRLIV